MASTYYSGLIPDFWSKYNQKRAATGRAMSQSEMSGLIEPMLNYDYQKSLAAEERAQRQRELDRQYGLQAQKMKDERSAATTSGLLQTAGLGGNLYMANKYMGILDKGIAAKTPNFIYTPEEPFGTGLLPTTGGGAANAGLTTAGGAAGETGLIPISAAASEAETLAGAGSGLAETPGLLETFGGEAAGGGLLPTAGVGLLGGGVGYGLSKLLGANKDITQSLTYTGAGAGAGAMIGAEIGSVGGPLGALVGAGIGLLVSLFD